MGNINKINVRCTRLLGTIQIQNSSFRPVVNEWFVLGEGHAPDIIPSEHVC